MQLSFKETTLTDKRSPSFSSVNLKLPKFGWNTLMWTIICLGIFLRIFHFFDNRSLWTDEVFLAGSLIRMDFMELATQPLEYQQKAPIGFLWMTKLAVHLFGNGEMALRLFSLICGVASLLVFLPVSRYFLRPPGALIAMCILAFAPPLIYHSVEAKQYSTELLATTIALFLFLKFHKKSDFLSLTLWGAAGAAILWFSFSSIFILAGIAFGLSLYFLAKKNFKHFFRSLLPFSMWLASFVVHYFIFLEGKPESAWLVAWFEVRGGFMPLPPTSLADFKWFLHLLYDIQRYPLGLSWTDLTHENQLIRVLIRMPIIPILSLAVGFVVLFRKNKKLFLILTFPILLTLFASAIKAYPLYERLMVFLAPLLILFIAYGCNRLLERFSTRKWKYLLPLLLLAGPVWSSTSQFVNSDKFGDYKRSKQRSAFLYVNEHFREGDVVYVNWNSIHTYRFYKDSYALKFNAIEGKDPRFISENYAEYFQHLKPDIETLDGKNRVWLIYHKRVWLNIGDYDGQPEWYFKRNVAGGGSLLHEKFLELGKETDTYQNAEFNVSLLDLSVK